MSGHDRGVFSRRTENVLSVLLIVAAVVMAWRFWLSNETPTVSRQPTIVGEWRAFGDGGNRLESPNLPVTMVVFSDYECPHCRRLWDAVDSVLQDPNYGVSVVYRHYFNADNHPNAANAALAAECAAPAGRFLEYHRLLFASQESFDRAPWMRLAVQAGVEDLNAFDECVSERSVAARIVEDREAAKRLGVQATPTFLVNDEQRMGAVGPAELRLLLQRKLADAIGERIVRD